MPEHRFSISDPSAFLEISELIFRNCKPGERVEIELPLKGCAESLAIWQTDQQRLFRKLEVPPKIHVSVNQTGEEEVIVRTETEVVMNRAIIKNILERISPIERIRQWIPNERPIDADKAAEGPDQVVPLNILYSALKDALVAHNLDIRSLDSGSDVTNSIRSVRIWPQTERSESFITKNSRYGTALETGIRRFIQNGANHWPVLKAAPDMLIEVNYEKNQEHETSSDFYIDFDWGNGSETASPFKLPSTEQTGTSLRSIGKKRLPHPLTVTVDCGFSPMNHEITHVPCRINCLSGDWSEISLADCKYVSKNHIALDLVNGQLVLLDQGSSHGTFTAAGEDLRQMPGRQYPIHLNSSNEIFLCFGSTEQQVSKNRNCSDRKMFPRLVIDYGRPTPEIDGIDGTPELDNIVNS